MISVVVSQWNQMIPLAKNIYDAYLYGKDIDLTVAIEYFKKHKTLFDEKILFSDSYKNVTLHWHKEWLRSHAEARLKAVQSMSKLLPLERLPIEYFEHQGMEQYSFFGEEVILNFRHDKDKANAFLR